MNIYVGNLDYDTTEDELRQAFSEFGQISSVKIIKDRDTFRSKGFGFIEIPNKQQAQQAIDDLHNSELGGKNIVVNEAKPRNDRDKGGRNGRRQAW